MSIGCENMKRKILLLIIPLICSGCNNHEIQEQKIITCREDLRYDIYAVTNENYIYSKNQEIVSSVKTSSVYTASFDDTDFSFVKQSLENLQKDYQQNYQGVKTNIIEEQSQIVFTIDLPMNDTNLAQLKAINHDIFDENGNIPVEKYKAMLESSNYICK